MPAAKNSPEEVRFDREVLPFLDETLDTLYGADLSCICVDALGGTVASVCNTRGNLCGRPA